MNYHWRILYFIHRQGAQPNVLPFGCWVQFLHVTAFDIWNRRLISGHFLDTNILVYSNSKPRRTEELEKIKTKPGRTKWSEQRTFAPRFLELYDLTNFATYECNWLQTPTTTIHNCFPSVVVMVIWTGKAHGIMCMTRDGACWQTKYASLDAPESFSFLACKPYEDSTCIFKVILISDKEII